MMKIIIFGAGGQAKETIDLIEQNLKAQILGFVDVRQTRDTILGYKFLGRDEQVSAIIKQKEATHFFVAVGDLKLRARLYQRFKKELNPVSIISKRASISKYAKLGEHVIIYSGATINAEVSVGNNVYINSNVSIGHETKIGNHVNINPGANIAGRVIIEDFCTIGIGVSIKENIKIAKNTTVGGGAMVVKNTRANGTYTGIPARILQK